MLTVKLYLYKLLEWLFGYLYNKTKKTKFQDLQNTTRQKALNSARNAEKKILNQPHVSNGQTVDIQKLEKRIEDGTF